MRAVVFSKKNKKERWIDQMEKWIPNFCRSSQQYLAGWWIVL